MALEGDDISLDVKKAFNLLNYVFNAIYIVEFIIKILGFGPLGK